jgi:hypothetical protein
MAVQQQLHLLLQLLLLLHSGSWAAQPRADLKDMRKGWYVLKLKGKQGSTLDIDPFNHVQSQMCC